MNVIVDNDRRIEQKNKTTAIAFNITVWDSEGNQFILGNFRILDGFIVGPMHRSKYAGYTPIFYSSKVMADKIFDAVVDAGLPTKYEQPLRPKNVATVKMHITSAVAAVMSPQMLSDDAV